MLIDNELVLEEAMDISATASAAKTKDTKGAGASEGHYSYARFLITEAPTAGFLIFGVESSDDDTTYVVEALTREYDYTELPVGTLIKVAIPAGIKRYIGAAIVADPGSAGGTAHVDLFHG